MRKKSAREIRNGSSRAILLPAELEDPGDARGGWVSFFADESLVLPSDFEPPEDPPVQDDG